MGAAIAYDSTKEGGRERLWNIPCLLLCIFLKLHLGMYEHKDELSGS